MTTTAPTNAAHTPHSDEFIEVAGLKLHVLRGGSGKPALVLHHDLGNNGWTEFYRALAGSSAVVVPEHPGYGQSERPQWMRSVRDMAAVHQWAIQALGLKDVSLVGLGFGGWIAAEMASQAPADFRRLVLVGAMGIQPREGEILDQALYNHIAYVRAGLHDQSLFETLFGADPETDQLEAWEIHRDMTFRIAWKPYMFNPSLPHLLGGVQAPALLVWGDDDQVVPRECADLYAAALPRARIEIVPDCGHLVDLEQPQALAKLVNDFLA
ncbi:MAG TPA: alpha/beta hydrolase [Dehalococcoidia bacterium]|nr:alpha/beta hydrolase [Dehalococcoidia bacterium]